uniref:fimbrial biogenesis chaperone n=1 Tax=Castellaniella defragrans TaxID=75697 RepID=UPI003340F8C0
MARTFETSHMKTLIQRLLPAIVAAGMLIGGGAQAAIQISSTRVVMNEEQQHVSVFAKNLSSEPYVVQVWIDGAAEEMDTPFFITPPLSRFDGGVERRLNISRVGEGMPNDRESYYWINVLEIPQKKDHSENVLSLAVQTRIKLFYRPAAIQKLPRGPELLKWSLAREGKACQLVVENASAFLVNFARIELASETNEFGRGVVAAPLAASRIPLSKCPSAANPQVIPHVVNDYGVIRPWPAAVVDFAAPPVP